MNMSGKKTKGSAENNIGKWRIMLISSGLMLCVGVVGWKATDLQITKSEFLQDQGDNRTIRTIPIAANRGLITDRNGEPLAVSTPVQSIWVDPRRFLESDNVNEAAQKLASVLELNGEVLRNRIDENSRKGFLYVKRRIPPAEAQKVLAMELRGVYAQDEYQRYYPHGEVTAHLVGFSNVDDEGLEGLELTYDHVLKGTPGERQVMKEGRGHIIDELKINRNAEPGKDLELSIDFRLQNLAYRELKAEFLTRRAKAASVVVLDVDSGEVLAMANQPSYNPHSKSNITDFGVLRNRALTDVFEPGSTIKAFTIAAALESGLYAPSTVVDTHPGWMMVNGHEVNDHGVNYGELTVEQVVTKSSNIGSSKIALEIGPEPIRDVLARVGFGQVSGTGFPGERGGVLPNHRRWSRIEIATLSYGYGLSSSALQLAQSYAVIAAGGIKRPVSLLKLDDESLAATEGERVIDAKISQQVLDMLKTVVDRKKGGTAIEANVPFYSVAGKTGTAHVVGEFGYEENLHNSLFVGMAPAHDPKIVVVVIVYEPKGDEHFGGQVSAPVFSRIVSGAMRILNVAPDVLPPGDATQLTSR
ncbi:MAG: penicillin-binding protein 3 [Pseudohongiella sp.]|nr:MAG: penicillin-binding protein 3 [Pseudohongiella sp.]